MPTEANWGDAAINQVVDRLVSYAASSGRYVSVNGHEPKNAPGNGPACSIWAQKITPVKNSGIAATSGLAIFSIRIYMSFVQQPFDAIDPAIMAAVSQFMAALTGDFQFSSIPNANIRHVDLLGANGVKLEANAGYMEIDKKMFRVMTITCPIVINDMWTQVA